MYIEKTEVEPLQVIKQYFKKLKLKILVSLTKIQKLKLNTKKTKLLLQKRKTKKDI